MRKRVGIPILILCIALSGLLVLGEGRVTAVTPPPEPAVFLPVILHLGAAPAAPTLGPSPTPTPAGTPTPTPSVTPTRPPTGSPTATRTAGPTQPATLGPSPTPTRTPTGGPGTPTPTYSYWTPRPTTVEVLNVPNVALAHLGETVVYSVGFTNYTEETVMLSLVDTFPPELDLEQAWNLNCGGPGLTYTATHSLAAEVQVSPWSACQLVIAVVVQDPCACAVTSTVGWQAPTQGWSGQAVGEPAVFLSAEIPTVTPTPGGQP